MPAAVEPRILVGSARDAAQAQHAFESLTAPREQSTGNLTVGVIGSATEYLVLVEAPDRRLEQLAADIFRAQGISPVEHEAWLGLLHDARNLVVHGGTSSTVGADLLGRFFLVFALGLLRQTAGAPGQVRSPGRARRSKHEQDDHRRRIAEADAELAAVSEGLEAALRAERSDLFDRRGRLKPKAVAALLAEHTGGKPVLSGDDLSALEQAADAESSRSARAP